MNYKAIGFDYGGVISDFSSHFPEEASAALGISIQEFRKTWQKHNRKVNVEGMPFDEFLKVILNELGQPEKFSEIVAINAKNQKPTLNQRLLDCIKNLRAKGFKTGLLSNASHEMAKQMRAQGLEAYFDAFCISAEIGFMKPDKEAFELLCTALDVLPQELIFIDDTERSLETAKEVGFTDILYTDFETLERKLKELGVL